jgi:hypothetical protein
LAIGTFFSSKRWFLASADTVNGQRVIVVSEAAYGDLTMSVYRLCADSITVHSRYINYAIEAT